MGRRDSQIISAIPCQIGYLDRIDADKPCIFYTDDDPDDRETFRAAAKTAAGSWTVLTQQNGEELMFVLHNPPPIPCVILIDLNMPIRTGYDILRQIKSSDSLRNLPVIMYSTSDDPSAISKCRDLGASLYLAKPASFGVLKKTIEFIVSVDWNAFKPSRQEFVYRYN